MADGKGSIYTVGHSTHKIDDFLKLLTRNGITALADVRSVPASRFTPQFNRDTIKRALNEASIEYVFLGRELGARSDDRSLYVDGKVRYDRLARQPAFREGIERLLRGLTMHRIAVMCAEAEPLDCHRTLLVARELARQGVDIVHIHKNGELEPDVDAMIRLREKFGLEGDALFEDDDLLADALRRQEEEIAYVDGRLQESDGSAQ